MDQFRASRQSELRGGVAPWAAGLTRPIRQPLDRNLAVDVLIVGGGITGSMMAEYLARQDRKVCIIDRERPGFGSTAASTAMLEWEIDRSLTELSAFYGFERAADVYQLSHSAVAGLYRLAHSLRLPSALRPRDTVYLAAGDHGAKELLEEHELRKRAGLPGAFLGYRELRSEYGFDREAAIVSPGSAEVDPLLLSHALLSAAAERGASLFDAEATAYDSFGRGVHVATDNGCCIEAAHGGFGNLCGQRSCLVLGEAAQTQPCHLRSQQPFGRQFGPERENGHHPPIRQPLHDVPKQGGGGSVCPMQILDDEDDRNVLGLFEDPLRQHLKQKLAPPGWRNVLDRGGHRQLE